MRVEGLLTRLATLWSAPRRWATRHPWTDIVARFTVEAWLILLGTYLVLYLPMELLVGVSGNATRKGASGLPVELSTASKWTLFASIVAVAISSAALAGFTRAFLTRSVGNRWWALLFVVAGVTLPIGVGHMLRPLPTLSDVQVGDAPLIISYVAAYLLLVGYLSKVPWDHARDLWDCRYKQLSAQWWKPKSPAPPD